MPYEANKEELEILEFWKKNQTFEKSVSERPEDNPYVFYDGPPFATGLPHYGHILSSVIKDVVPRYWTMKGFRVRRRWGWDCHGLPIESLIEKELNISGKKQIEDEIGVDKFNEACKSKVLMYTNEWKKMVDREGRWVEFDNSYKTMDPTYMESVWWALKKIWDGGKIYEGRKVLMYCVRCETPVSKAEIAMDNSYKDITEETATVRFRIKNQESGIRNMIGFDGDVFVLAWTTTPWTLPGNVALAVGNDVEYAVVRELGIKNQESRSEYFVVASDRLSVVFKGKEFEVIKTVKGADLVGLEYEPLFDMPAMREGGKKAYYVTAADFVTTAEGTGIVHTAVIYGEDDYNLGLKIDLPMVPMLDSKGHFNDAAPEFIKGEYFKKAEKAIKTDLESRGLLFARDQNTHSYPHCWRCETPLIYNAISAWFIDIQSVKNRLIELNKKINWYPEHLKEGRFLNILETAPDWNISRNRYWATPLPFWRCGAGNQESRIKNQGCDAVVCIGSVKELKEKAINFSEVYTTDKLEEMDLHKQFADRIKLRCEKCEGEMTRIPEVVDCWVESGSMPFAEFHYPFENEETFKKRFPGQFIAEYINQTRAWFYYMHVMAVLLFDNVSFENVVTTGVVLNEKGEKMSKSKKNYPDPWVIIEQYGVDAVRYYMMTSPVMQADNLFFSEREVKDVYNKVLNILWNVVTFYGLYAGENQESGIRNQESANVLDRWILAKLQLLVKDVTVGMDGYNTVQAARPIKEFIDELSTWYLRRSRDRFKGDDEADKQAALATLREVLLTLAKVMAPFTPFVAEKIYELVGGEMESVHLEAWPVANEKMIDQNILSKMLLAREIVARGLFARKIISPPIPVRQSLRELCLGKNYFMGDEYLSIVKDELNIKHITAAEDRQDFSNESKWFVIRDFIGTPAETILLSLDIEITEELKKEGWAREIVRAINQMRKDTGLTPSDTIDVEYSTNDEILKSVFEKHGSEIQKSVLAKSLKMGEGGTEIEIDGKKLSLKLTK